MLQRKNNYIPKKTIKKEKYFYACYVKTCKARVFLNSEVCYKVKDFIDHNHETQEDTYRELKIMNNMKTSCMGIHQDSTEPSVLGSIRKIFQSTCVEYPVETKDIDFYKLQRNYQKPANKQFLISPKTPADVIKVFQAKVTLKKFGCFLLYCSYEQENKKKLRTCV
nr:uncharacterized protein LOC118682379 [Bactrocera oleae]